MAPVFSPDIIARVKDETDIVEIVRQHVTLKQAGGVFKGLCPFHKEKTPSFIVTPARQRYHCFGCASGGDVISFLMEIEGLTFPEAVEILARPLDIDLSSWLREDEGEGERRAFHRANEAAMTLWRDALWDQQLGGPALKYMKDRGFNEKVLRDFDVGWAPGGSGWLENGLKKAGVDFELATQADLLRPSDRGGAPFAYFRNRIIFPVRNISRQVAGFGGRVLGQGEPKYLNSSDSAYYSKGKLLYGFEASRMAISREKSAILVEGYMDLLALAQAGVFNVVATCGTAFTPDQVRVIKRGAPNVVLLFDGDKAGLKAAVRSADIALRGGLEPKIVRLPQGKDPDDIVMEGGAEAITTLLNTSKGYIPFLRDLADQRGDDREVRERALRQALGTIAGIGDPLRREYVLQEAAKVFGVGEELLREMVAREEAANVRRNVSYKESGDPKGSVAQGQTQAGNRTGADTGTASNADTTRMKVVYNPRVNAERIEPEMFSHILMDDSGEAARVFLAERGDLLLQQSAAETLCGELEKWAAEAGPGQSPREFVLDRWNLIGDTAYRSLVSQLIDKEGRPDRTDFTKVVRDCLGRLTQSRPAAEA